LISESTAVVHTLGILLEDQGYKAAVNGGNVFGVVKALAAGLSGSNGNPLKNKVDKRRGYEGMNRDSGGLFILDWVYSLLTSHPIIALTVLDTMLHTKPIAQPIANEAGPSRPFVYISAADAFRPLVPSRYIETKREAEFEIGRRCETDPDGNVRPVFMRPGWWTFPVLSLAAIALENTCSVIKQYNEMYAETSLGLMYHPHIRPVSTLPAFLLSLSASAHDRLGIPNIFASKSLLGGAADALRSHPLHVDHVASAVLRCIEDGEMQGVVDIQDMRRWAGFLGTFGGKDVPPTEKRKEEVHA